MPKPTKAQLLILLLLAVMAFGGGAQYGRYQLGREQAAAALLNPVIEQNLAPQAQPAAPAEAPPAAEPPPLFVDVKGAVQNPGVYQLPAGSRVADALELAELLPEANTDIINLAAPLNDGAELIIPFRQEGEETDWQALAQQAVAQNTAVSAAASGGGQFSGVVNINSASLSALQSLAGIGPAKAQAIITYREQHGPFAKIEDIKKVSGIGTATYDNIKDSICVE